MVNPRNAAKTAAPTEKQVVSKQRVADHGEVLTGKREVNAMLDLVKAETERIDSRFLEPACGDGNFLAEILCRKLKVVKTRYGKSQHDFEFNALIALASIYGIDILEDNVVTCRRRLLHLFEGEHDFLFNRNRCRDAARYLLERNIIWGDALTLQTATDPPQPIVFSEWAPINGTQIKRRDFTFHELLSYAGTRDRPLFSDLGEEAFIPTPVKQYPPAHFLRLADAEPL